MGRFLLAALLFSSCKKERQPAENLPDEKNLEIRLNTAYQPVTKIDSALLAWEAAEQVQRHTFACTGDTLRLLLTFFTEGQGRMKIQL